MAPRAGSFQASQIFLYRKRRAGRDLLLSRDYLSCLSKTSRSTPLLIITIIKIILNKSHSDATLVCKCFLLICIFLKDHADTKLNLFLSSRIKLAMWRSLRYIGLRNTTPQ